MSSWVAILLPIVLPGIAYAADNHSTDYMKVLWSALPHCYWMLVAILLCEGTLLFAAAKLSSFVVPGASAFDVLEPYRPLLLAPYLAGFIVWSLICAAFIMKGFSKWAATEK